MNTPIFFEYAPYFDAYYNDKNYLGEVNYLLGLAADFGIKEPKSILDIGCGTGRHLVHLASMGFNVTGFDLSEEMIRIAKKRIKHKKIPDAYVEVANATEYRDGGKYDLVISMFTTMGFITANNDFRDALKTARTHLDKNGLFIFDCWFGPAVLNIRPSIRINEFEMEGTRAIRIVEPIEVDPIRHVIKTKNTILHTKRSMILNHIVEFHKIRFFFIQELILFFEKSGFELIFTCPFMNPSKQVTISDWNISVVARAI